MKFKKDIGRSKNDVVVLMDLDLEACIPNFEESSSCVVRIGDKHVYVFGPSSFSLKRECTWIHSFLLPRMTLGSRLTIDAKWKQIEKNVVWECITRWQYDACILFNAANYAYYQPIIYAIISCGLVFKGYGFHDIKGSLLPNEVQRIYEYLKEFKQSCTKIGCIMMYYRCLDGISHNILCFLIVFPKGTMFMKSVDAFHQVKDAKLLFCLLDEVVVEVGVENVIQVIIDIASMLQLEGCWRKNIAQFCVLHVQPIILISCLRILEKV